MAYVEFVFSFLCEAIKGYSCKSFLDCDGPSAEDTLYQGLMCNLITDTISYVVQSIKVVGESAHQSRFSLLVSQPFIVACIQRMLPSPGVKVLCGFKVDSGKYLVGQSIVSLFFVERNL